MIPAGFILATALIADPGRPNSELQSPEIVVTAPARGKCRVELADRALSNGQLAARAKAWAQSGIAIRVVRPRGAGYRCLAKVAFSLEKHGVRLIEFVERDR